MKNFFIVALALSSLIFAGSLSAQSVNDRIQALKASVAESNAILHHYKWVETTIVSVNGEEKMTKQQQCYYGDDGSLQKVTLDQSSNPGRTPLGPFRRAIVENKREEMTDYMKSAVALVKSYVPPSSRLIQQARDSGNVSINLLNNSRARLVLHNYQQQGDSYIIEVNLANNRPVGLKVNTYLNDPSQLVKLDVDMGTLNNGANFPARIVLNAEAKNMTIVVTNSGYERAN